jgi:hypothetical protein
MATTKKNRLRLPPEARFTEGAKDPGLFWNDQYVGNFMPVVNSKEV